jgi:hypothetical protein
VPSSCGSHALPVSTSLLVPAGFGVAPWSQHCNGRPRIRAIGHHCHPGEESDFAKGTGIIHLLASDLIDLASAIGASVLGSPSNLPTPDSTLPLRSGSRTRQGRAVTP